MEKMIPVVRHLEDINNLSAFGRDGGIVEGQDENIKRIANEIFSEINLIDNETAFLVTSPRNRAVETAYAVKESLKKMSNEAVKIKVLERCQ